MNSVTSRKGMIWWDFDGTLVATRPRWSEAAHQLLTAVVPNHRLLHADFGKVFSSGFPWHGPNYAHPELDKEDWWESIHSLYSEAFHKLGYPEAADPTILANLRAIILASDAYIVFADVAPVLSSLSAKVWRHIIVSNHVPELPEVVAALGLNTHFDEVLTSGIVGYEKPHPQMFQTALSYTRSDEPIWMVGDSVEADCRPGVAAGAQAILVRRPSAAFLPYAADLWEVLKLIEADEGTQDRLISN